MINFNNFNYTNFSKKHKIFTIVKIKIAQFYMEITMVYYKENVNSKLTWLLLEKEKTKNSLEKRRKMC